MPTDARGGQSHDQHQRGNGEAAAADAGESDRQRNQESDCDLHQLERSGSWRPLASTVRGGVDAAFQFRAAPAAGARVGACLRNGGAGLAADAAVAHVVERQVIDFIVGGVLPDLAPGPRGERADFQQHFAAGEFVVLDDLQVLARGRLFAAQAGEPDVILLQGFEKRLDLAQIAALAGIGAVQDAELGFLLGDGFFRREILEIQIPGLGHAVAIGVGFGKVVAGIEKQHRNIRHALAQKVEDDHVLGLEAAGEAGRAAIFGEHAVDGRFGGERFEFFGSAVHGLAHLRL